MGLQFGVFAAPEALWRQRAVNEKRELGSPSFAKFGFGVISHIQNYRCSLLTYRGGVKLPFPGYENAAGKLRQKWLATAGTKFT